MKYLLALAIVILGGWRFLAQPKKPADTQPLELETQTSAEGPVTVGVTPDLASAWRFQIVLNTHSEELDQDLTQVVSLQDDKGKSYRPIAWEGAPPGGHHREGVLSFPALSPRPKAVTLVVKDVGGIAERRFFWKL